MAVRRHRSAQAYPKLDAPWSLVEREGVTHLGTSPRYFQACRARVTPKESHDMSRLRVVFSTGSPLTDEDFRYVYAKVKEDVMLASISGGTDICSCFALGNPTLPVRSQRPFPTGSELQVRVTVTPSGDGFATVSINAGARRRAPGLRPGHGRPGLR